MIMDIFVVVDEFNFLSLGFQLVDGSSLTRSFLTYTHTYTHISCVLFCRILPGIYISYHCHHFRMFFKDTVGHKKCPVY